MEYEYLPILKEGESFISGEELLKRAKEMNAVGTKEDCDYLLAHTKELEGMEDYYVVFTGYTKLSNGRNGVLWVACLSWNGGRWYLDFNRLDVDWVEYDRLPRKVSEPSDTGIQCPALPPENQMMCICGALSEEKKKEIDDDYWESWEQVFNLFTKGDDSLGSAGWMVAPSTIKGFIKGLLESRKLRIIEKLQTRFTTGQEVCSGGFLEAIKIVKKEL